MGRQHGFIHALQSRTRATIAFACACGVLVCAFWSTGELAASTFLVAVCGATLLGACSAESPKQNGQSGTSAGFLQEVIDAIDAHICILNDEGSILHTNSRWNVFTPDFGGLPASVGVGGNYLDVFRAAQGACRPEALRAVEGMERVLAGELDSYNQLYACHSPTDERWFRMEVRPLADPTYRRVVVAHFNVTGEELAKQELRKQREQSELLALVAKYTDNAVVITDAESRIEWVNDGFTRLTGYSLDEVLGRVPGHFLQGPETDPRTIEIMRRALRKQRGFNVEILNYSKDQRKYWVNVEVRPIRDARGEVSRFIAVEADVTKRRETEERLRLASSKSEELVQALQESQRTLDYALFGAEVGLWQWNIETNETIYSQRWADLLGFPLESFHQSIDAFNELLHPEDIQRVWDAVEAHCHDPSKPYEMDYRLRTSSGEYRWFHAKGRVIETTENGQPRLMAGTVADVHEKKLVEQVLERERLLLSSIVNTLPHSIFWKDRKSVYRGCNRAFADHAGLKSPQEIVGLTDYDLPWTRTEAEHFRNIDAQVMESGKPLLNHEEPITGGDATKTILTSKVPLKDKEGKVTGILGIYHDITERKQLQMRLAQSQKLESIGQLAAGIAHEINTPMQFVHDNIEFLNECLGKLFDVVHAYQRNLCPEASPRSWEERYREVNQALEQCRFDRIQRQVPEAVSESLDGLKRVIQIVRAIKQFSHPGSETKSPADLNEGLRSTATISRNQWKYVADLKLELDPELPPVECLPAELNQVFLNLIVNAADAVGEKCASGALERGSICVRTRREGDDAVVEVEDNGCGIPEHVRQHVFVPFFTTKRIGQGSGQGLPISYDVIVNKHGGTIDFVSAPGEGTVFTVRIPIRSPRDGSAVATGDECSEAWDRVENPPSDRSSELEPAFA